MNGDLTRDSRLAADGAMAMWRWVKAWFGTTRTASEPEFISYDIKDLYPILVPKAFAETGQWVGPIESLDVDGLDQTWGVLTPPNRVNYLDREMIASWEGQGADWRTAATQNLARLAGERAWSHELRDDDGRLILVCFMHEDGFGPSRLLIPELLSTVFPGGYEVAVPELTCAVAIGRVEGDEDPRAEAMIRGCFEGGTRPVSARRYKPDVFWTP